MKKTFLGLVVLLCSGFDLQATITYATLEWVPKGRNYSLRTYPPMYLYLQGYTNSEIVWISYTKANGQYQLTALMASKALEQKIPVRVLKYIGDFVVAPKLQETRSLKDAENAMRDAVVKALDQTWLNTLKNEGDSFSKRPLYDRDNAPYTMNYYEFFPVEENDLTNPTSIDDNVVSNAFFENKEFASEAVLLKNNDKIIKVDDSKLKKPDFDKTDKNQLARYQNLTDVIAQLKSINYHHKNLKVSDWPLASETKWELYTSTPSGFHAKIDTACKYLMILQPAIQENEFMPGMAWKENVGNWKATRCNLFVYDFTLKGTNTGPWDNRDYTDANKLYAQLPNNKDFVKISWKEAWLYATIGYPVMITTPQIGPAAHIGFAFPIDLSLAIQTSNMEEGQAKTNMISKGIVVQAGNSIGKMELTKGFSEGALNGAKIYVYLGYLSK